jgi:hypothetical protein
MKIQTDIPPHILKELEAEKPSIDPAYWAKSSCKECHGRGIVGNIKSSFGKGNVVTQQLICSCAQKKYRKWLEQKYEERKKAKS